MALVILVIAFGTLVAAGIPVLIGVLASLRPWRRSTFWPVSTTCRSTC